MTEKAANKTETSARKIVPLKSGRLARVEPLCWHDCTDLTPAESERIAAGDWCVPGPRNTMTFPELLTMFADLVDVSSRCSARTELKFEVVDPRERMVVNTQLFLGSISKGWARQRSLLVGPAQALNAAELLWFLVLTELGTGIRVLTQAHSRTTTVNPRSGYRLGIGRLDTVGINFMGWHDDERLPRLGLCSALR